MSPRSDEELLRRLGAPRVSGDEPMAYMSVTLLVSCSPRERG